MTIHTLSIYGLVEQLLFEDKQMKKINLVNLIGYMETYSNYGKSPYYMLNPETFEIHCMDEMDDFQKKKCIMIPKVDIYKLQLDFIHSLNSSIVIKNAKEVENADPDIFSAFFHDLTEANAFYEYLGRDVEKEWFDIMDEAIYSRAALWCEENHFPYEIVFSSTLSNGKELAKEYGEKINRNRKKLIREIKARKQVDLVNLFCYVEYYPNLFKPRLYFMNPKNHKIYDEDEIDDKKKSEYLKLPKIDVNKIEVAFINGLNSEAANEAFAKINREDPCEYIDFIQTLFETPKILGKIVKGEWDQFLYRREIEQLSKWCEENDIPYEVTVKDGKIVPDKDLPFECMPLEFKD